jgi:hypothetical protein
MQARFGFDFVWVGKKKQIPHPQETRVRDDRFV